MTTSQQSGRVGVIAGVVLGSLAVLLTGMALMLVELNGGDISDSDTTGSGMLALSFGVAGALLVSRRPHSVIGWILLVSGVFNSINAFSAEYPNYALVADLSASLPAGGALAWMGSWAWAVGASGLPLILWLFPTGRPTTGWRWLGWVIGAGAALAIVPMAVATSGNAAAAIEIGRRPDQVVSGLPATLTTAGTALLGLSLLLGLVSAVVRYRRARSDERQQQKWLALAGLLTLIALITVSPAAPLEWEGVWAEMFSWIGILALPTIPAAITLAILRYRLYDIDRIISRTVTYGLVVAVLVAVYVAGVFAVQAVSPASGNLGVATSTLAAAALFSPLRRRVQEWVNRRFDRRRYDAARVVEEFAHRLRTEVSMGDLSRDLVTVVSETMQPAAISMWLLDSE